MSETADVNHERAFALAWADPGSTRFERPPAEVNAVLTKHYRLSRPVAFTRASLGYGSAQGVPSGYVHPRGRGERWRVLIRVEHGQLRRMLKINPRGCV